MIEELSKAYPVGALCRAVQTYILPPCEALTPSHLPAIAERGLRGLAGHLNCINTGSVSASIAWGRPTLALGMALSRGDAAADRCSPSGPAIGQRPGPHGRGAHHRGLGLMWPLGCAGRPSAGRVAARPAPAGRVCRR